MTAPPGTGQGRRGPQGRLGRRAALAGLAAAAAGVWWGWPRLAPHLVGAFDFAPLDDPPGFRRLAAGRGGAQSAGGAGWLAGALVGLSPEASGAQDAPRDAAADDLCTALFGAPPPSGVVPIAAFSDYNCPYCRVVTERLAALEARSAGAVRLAWHEWPRLGETSVTAARAALAADLQGGYAAFHARLMRARALPTPAYLAVLAQEAGLDPVRLAADMESAAVTRRLATTAALARRFGLVGTPSLVVGRTLVVGAVPEAVIAALVARERSELPVPGCAPSAV